MPRTLTWDWTETEVSWGSVDEKKYYYRRERVKGKSITEAHIILAKRAARWKTHPNLQRETWTCPYCNWHATSRVKNRRSNIQEQFTQLANIWKQDTGHLSNITTRAMHPAYQRIIGMGREAVPFILEEFTKGELDDWFWALYAITGENPITEEIAGDMNKMAEAWLRWGRETGYLSDSIQQMKPSSRT